MSVTPREPCSGTLFRLRNLYPRSTQNTDVSSTIFSKPGVSYLMIMLLYYKDYLIYMLLRSLGKLSDSNGNNINTTIRIHDASEQDKQDDIVIV